MDKQTGKRIGVYISEELLDQCDAAVEKNGADSRSEFICDAILHYIAVINMKENSRVLTPALESIIGSKIALTEDRINRIVFTYQYYQDVVAWHSEVIKVITQLKVANQASEKKTHLAELSALIETGRFYFPNIDRHDNFGANKPLAYRGYRNVVLDFLVYEYQLFNREDSSRYVKHAESLQRLFTSYVFQHLDPKKHQKKVKHNTSIQMKNEITINEYIKQSPESIYALYPIDSNRSNWEAMPTQRGS